MSAQLQNDRVLAALRANPSGITRVAFQAPDVIDGLEPILNFPGRIHDLRNQGHQIVSDGRRNRCLIFKLAGAPGQSATGGGKFHTTVASTGQPGLSSPSVPAEPVALFDEPSMYDRFGDAA